MNNDNPTLDPARCPLCGGDNRCAMEVEKATGQKQGPCWCVAQPFAPELLASLRARERGKACICASCLARFNAGLAQNSPPRRAP